MRGYLETPLLATCSSSGFMSLLIFLCVLTMFFCIFWVFFVYFLVLRPSPFILFLLLLFSLFFSLFILFFPFYFCSSFPFFLFFIFFFLFSICQFSLYYFEQHCWHFQVNFRFLCCPFLFLVLAGSLNLCLLILFFSSTK